MIDLEQVIEKAENIYNFYLDSNWEIRIYRSLPAAIKKEPLLPIFIPWWA